jgi:predicted acylesterase/phospholipase RssA
MDKTIAFKNVIGVFEGGGVRGAAFAGAYSRAREAGISFLGAVGASAGAMAASLVAADAPVQAVRDVLSTRLTDLLIPAENPYFRRRWGVRLSHLLGRRAATLVENYLCLGRFSSERLEGWINSILKDLIPNTKNDVRFSDLPKPLAIIATDLRRRTFKVWSSSRTPDSSVAFAVRCSCSIPFFFQPVSSESSSFVDGGVIANLPLFLASELELEATIPKLCFRLIRDRESECAVPQNGGELIESLIDTVLSSVSEIQLNLASDRQVIEIPTGKITATQFDLSPSDISGLIQAGEEAVERFIREEQQRITSSSLSVIELRGFREGLLEQTVSLLRRSRESIAVLAGDLSWLRDLIVPMLAASLRGVQLRILCESESSSTFLEARQAAIAIGASVREISKKTPLKATLIDSGLPTAAMITIEQSPRTHGRVYYYPHDHGQLTVMIESYERYWEDATQIAEGGMPTLEMISEEELVRALKHGVWQYANLSIGMERIDLHNTRPLSAYLERFKLARLQDLSSIITHYSLGQATRIVGAPWAITPPVVERLRDGVMVVVDGTHRLFSELERQTRFIDALVVENPHSNLPAQPLPNWSVIRIVSEKKTREERYHHFQPSNFREIRRAFQSMDRTRQ